MILVTLGTQDKKFTRLLDLVQKEIDKKNIVDEVIVQAGYTKYKSNDMKIFELISSDKFDKYIEKADIIITHGGVGSIVGAIKKGKKVIAVPRLKKYKEHTNDHQIQICTKFMELGYIKMLNENDDLGEKIKEMKKFKPKKYISNTKNIINTLEKYIDNI